MEAMPAREIGYMNQLTQVQWRGFMRGPVLEHGHLEQYPLLSSEPMEGDECIQDVVCATQTEDKTCCHVHHRLKLAKKVGCKTDQNGIFIVQIQQYQRDDKSLECSHWHKVSDRMQLPENRKASGDCPLHMHSHHKVCINEDTQVTNGLD